MGMSTPLFALFWSFLLTFFVKDMFGTGWCWSSKETSGLLHLGKSKEKRLWGKCIGRLEQGMKLFAVLPGIHQASTRLPPGFPPTCNAHIGTPKSNHETKTSMTCRSLPKTLHYKSQPSPPHTTLSVETKQIETPSTQCREATMYYPVCPSVRLPIRPPSP